MTDDMRQFGTAFQQATQQQQQAMTGLRGATQGTQQTFQQLNQQLNVTRQSFTQNVSIIQNFNTTLNQTHTQLNQVTNSLRGAQQGASGFSSAWQQMFQIAGGIGIATSIEGLVSGLVSFARETVTVGTRTEQLRASLSALAGSTSAGQQQFDQLFQTAQRLGVPFEALARGWRTLTAAATQAGLPIAEQRRLLEAVATEGRRVGASNEELSRAFLALGQMASKGVVSMEELRQQLGEALPTALAAMAQGMGRTTEELIKLVEAGGVRFPTAARALTRGLEDLQRAGQTTGDTLQTAFNRFSNELIRSRDELMKMSGPLKAITEGATSFLKILNDSAQAQRQLREAQRGESLIGTGLREGDVSRLSAQQQRALTEINRILGEQILQQGDPNAPPMFQPSREEYIKELQARRAAILGEAQAIKAQTDEQMKATAEINKARAAQQLQADTVADLTKQMDALTKAGVDFRNKAAISPELFGRERGTLEEQAQFQQGRAQAVKSELEALATSVAKLPAGVTLPPETLARVRALNAEYGGVLKNIDAIEEKQKAAAKAERDAESEAKRRAREAQQDAEHYQTAIDNVTMALARQRDQAIETLQRIQSQFSQTREERAEDRIAALRARFPGDEAVQAEADLAQAKLETRNAYNAEIEAAQASFAVIKEHTRAVIEAEEKQRTFSLSLQQSLERLQTPKDEREALRLRQRAAREGLEITPADEAMLERIESQQRLNRILSVYADLAGAVGNAWVQALSNIADGTTRVSEAFAMMARSIMDSMARIATQKAFEILIRIGAGLLTSAFTGGSNTFTVGPETGATSSVGAGINPLLFGKYQGGGMITKPTMAYLGEGPANTLPEYILNREQMNSLLHASSASGGQGGGSNISIINVNSREQGEREAARERSMGRQVIINEVLSDLGQGEGSRIGRVMRTLAR